MKIGNKNAVKADSEKKTGKGRVVLDLEHWGFVLTEEAKRLGISKKEFAQRAIQHYSSYLQEQE